MNNIDTYKERNITKRKRQNRFCVLSIVTAISICIGAVQSCHHKEPKPVPNMLKSHKRLTDREWMYSQYFYKHGSKSPDQMAIAVLKTKSPKLLAKIAVSETNANHKLRKYGYKKKHDGAFGVNRDDWGKVSHDPIEQALQAEFALNTFLKESKGNIVVALNKYGGDSTDKYSRKILAELEHMP